MKLIDNKGGETGCRCVAYRSVSGLFFPWDVGSPAVCVSLRFKAFQQFGDNWREIFLAIVRFCIPFRKLGITSSN
jgi:hypothetical protein